MAIAIGLLSCGQSEDGCSSVDVTQDLGDVLYTGPYNPQRHETSKPPYQNFSLFIPETFTVGSASLNVAHFVLVGVSHISIRICESTNITSSLHDSAWPSTSPGHSEYYAQCPVKLTLNSSFVVLFVALSTCFRYLFPGL